MVALFLFLYPAWAAEPPTLAEIPNPETFVLDDTISLAVVQARPHDAGFKALLDAAWEGFGGVTGQNANTFFKIVLKALQGDQMGVDSIIKLMQAVDEYVPTPERDVDKPFLMAIEDVFSIKGRGTVVTGRIERGKIHPGDEVEILGFTAPRKTTVTGVEMFRKLLPEGIAGDNVGCLLRGIAKEDVERGQVLAAPGSVKTHTKFEGEVYVLTKEEGGRHKPFFTNYRPQFYMRTTDVTGTIALPEDVKMVMPGDNVRISVELITPVAMEEKQRFAIREGGRTVGAGVVSKILA